MVGRPPRPVEQKALVGRAPGRDSGGRPLPEVVVELPTASGVPDVPAELVTSRRARACPFLDPDNPTEAECAVCAADIAAEAWRELWTQGQAWLSMQRDRHILARLCRGYAEEAHLRKALDEDGPFVKGQRGGLVAHPAVTMLRVLEQQITKWEGLCGFNPSDGGRLGIKIGKGRGQSPLEELIARRATARRRPAGEHPAATKRAAGSN